MENICYDDHERTVFRLNAILRLSQMSDKSYTEIMDFALEEAIKLTNSKIGYIYYYNEDNRQFTLYSWSKSAMSQCSIMQKQSVYDLEKTGLWGEAVRQRKPIITNDYNTPNPYIKGYPKGHVKLVRHMNLPIFRQNKIVAVIGVANKEVDYTNMDVLQLELFMDALWNVIEKKKLEEELKQREQLFRTVADFTHDWEYWIKPDMTIIYCSPSCQNITGYSAQEFMDTQNLHYKIVYHLDAEIYQQHINEFHRLDNEMRNSYLQFRIVRKDGSLAWIEHVCKPVFDSQRNFLGRRVSNREISERKQKEEEIIISKDRINKLNNNIIKMLKVVSHDVRSPLVTISATLKLLLKGTYGSIPDNAANTINYLYYKVNDIIRFAEDCLVKAQSIDTEIQIEKNEIDLRSEVIEDVLAELASQIEDKEIFIDNRLGAIPSGRIMVNASKMWLKVVYRNLFSNAIKYGGHGCTIAFGYEDHGDYYRFNVYNSGAPIPEDKKEILFTKFGRISSNVDNKLNGVGMGLYIIKEIINQHGGDIWHESRPDGNDFIFTLPK